MCGTVIIRLLPGGSSCWRYAPVAAGASPVSGITNLRSRPPLFFTAQATRVGDVSDLGAPLSKLHAIAKPSSSLQIWSGLRLPTGLAAPMTLRMHSHRILSALHDVARLPEHLKHASGDCQRPDNRRPVVPRLSTDCHRPGTVTHRLNSISAASIGGDGIGDECCIWPAETLEKSCSIELVTKALPTGGICSERQGYREIDDAVQRAVSHECTHQGCSCLPEGQSRARASSPTSVDFNPCPPRPWAPA